MIMRPFQRHSDAEVGMHMTEAPLQESAFKHALQEFVSSVAFASSVAVNHEKLLAFEHYHLWLAMYLNANLFLQIRERP